MNSRFWLPAAFLALVITGAGALRGPDIPVGRALVAAVSDPVCGNAKKEVGEECDDGNTSNDDACTNSCLKAACGDGYLHKGVEQCDSALPGLCTAFCTKPGASQASSVSSSSTGPATCGNAVLETSIGEECDLGSQNGTSPYCTTDCRFPYCGDGKLGYGEECEPERDKNGEFVVAQCGQSCAAPVCDDDGACEGGCTWAFLPECGAAQATASSASSSASSVAPVQTPASAAVSSSAASAIIGSSSVRSTISSSRLSTSVRSSLPRVSSPVSSRRSSVSSRVSSVAFSSVRAVSSPSSSLRTSSSSLPMCGDGLQEGRELCDDGPLNSNVVPNACRTACIPAWCGDGIVDLGEECDDGNDVPGDGCAPGCMIAQCGNGVLELGEECDQGADNTDFLANRCTTQCRLPSCGDGKLDTVFGERCDHGQGNSNVLPDSCRLECVPAYCGDGVTDTGEACDDGNDIPDDGCDACAIPACPKGLRLQDGACVPVPAPLCLGDDCVVWSQEASRAPWTLILLLSIEAGLFSALLMRLLLMARVDGR